MMRARVTLVLVLLTLRGADAAKAQVGGIYAEYWNGNNWVPVPGFSDIDQGQPGLPSGSDVTISDAGIVPYRVYAAFPDTEDIGDIRIDGSDGDQPVCLTVGKFTDSTRYPTTVKRLDIPGARDIGRINSFLGRTEIQARAVNDFTDWIQSWKIVRLDAAGDLLGDIDHNDSADQAPTLGVVQVRAIAAGANITAFEGDIGAIRTTGDCAGAITAYVGAINTIDIGGDLLANVEASGAITSIDVTGDIGTSQSPISIGATGDIRTITASSIYAAIAASDPGGSGTWDVWRAEAATGALEGSIVLDRLRDPTFGSENGINTAGDLAASISIDRSALEPILIGGDFPSGRTLDIGRDLQTNTGQGTEENRGRIEVDGALAGNVSIGRSLLGPITIESSGGLQGQIVLNADNSGGVWMTGDDGAIGNGSVEVAGVALSPVPYYTNTSASIGGGAVGLAPFNFHPIASEPDDDSTVTSPSGLTTADLWYYGPVFVAGTGDGPYTIESRGLKPPSQNWTDVSSDYTVSVVNGTSRHVQVTKISGQFPVNREYRFVPYQSGSVKLLECDKVAGNPPVHDTSGDDHYSFSIPLGTLDSLDFSGDGTLDDADMTLWLLDQTDLDKDGAVTDADYAALEYVIRHGF